MRFPRFEFENFSWSLGITMMSILFVKTKLLSVVLTAESLARPILLNFRTKHNFVFKLSRLYKRNLISKHHQVGLWFISNISSRKLTELDSLQERKEFSLPNVMDDGWKEPSHARLSSFRQRIVQTQRKISNF